MDYEKIDKSLDRLIKKYTTYVKNINIKNIKTSIGTGNSVIDNLKKNELDCLKDKLL